MLDDRGARLKYRASICIPLFPPVNEKLWVATVMLPASHPQVSELFVSHINSQADRELRILAVLSPIRALITLALHSCCTVL